MWKLAMVSLHSFSLFFSPSLLSELNNQVCERALVGDSRCQGYTKTPCLSRAATLPKGTKLELGRGAHLGTPSSDNHTAAAS